MGGSILRKFSAVFIVTLLVCAAAGVAALRELDRTHQASRDFIHLGAERLATAQRLEASLYRAEIAEDLYLTKAQTEDLQRFHALLAQIRADGARLQALVEDEPTRRLVRAQIADVDAYATLVDRQAAVMSGQNPIEDPAVFRALLVKRGEALAAAQQATQRTLDWALGAGPLYVNRVEASFLQLGLWMLVLAAVFGLGATGAWVVGGRVVRQVSSMATAIREITAADDLERRVPVTSKDEVATLAQSFNSLLATQQALSHERAEAARRDKQRADAIEVAYRDLRQATEELQRSQQKLIEADKLATIGQLAAGVAHEINNPAASVLGNLGFIQSALPSLVANSDDDAESTQLHAEIVESLTDSITGLERMALIARDLGTFARRSDELELLVVTEPIDVALKMANFEIKYRAQVSREYDAVPPIAANRGRLQQVFLNLLINAAHAMPKGKIAANRIRVAARREDGHVRVEVSDTGSGIAPENLSRIFDPFFTTKPSGQGTGLGLAITNDIVHQHGGEISVESEPGKGTTFTLRFPIANAHR